MQSQSNYRKVLLAMLLVITVFLYGCNQAGITGQAVREQQAVQEQQTQQEPAAEAAQESVQAATGVCDGFGFPRTIVLADGSVQEYCYDPCNGDENCIATFDDIEEVDFVSAGSNAQPGSTQPTNTQLEQQSTSSGSSSSGSGSSGSGPSSGQLRQI